MTENTNSFEIIETKENDNKIIKLDSAIKYLELMKNSEEILKTNQILNALNFLSKCFDSNTDFSFSNLNQENQLIVTQILFNLIKIVLDYLKSSNILEENNLTTLHKILSQVIQTFFILTSNSDEFCELIFKTEPELVKFLFDLINLSFEIEAESDKFKFEFDKEDKKNLYKILIHLSKQNEKYKTNWQNSNEIISNFEQNLIFTEGVDSYWYLFIIGENLAQNDKKYDMDYKFNGDKNLDENGRNETRNFALKYLNFLLKPEIIFKSVQAAHAIFYLCNNVSLDFSKILPEFQQFFIEFCEANLNYLYNYLDNIFKTNTKEEIIDSLKQKTKTTIKDVLAKIKNISILTVCYSNDTIDFCEGFHVKVNGIKVLIQYLKNESFVNYLIDSINEKIEKNLIKDCTGILIGTIHNLSRFWSLYSAIWNECDAFKTILDLSNTLKSVDEDFTTHLYMVISNIATDEQINTLSEIKMVIKNISNLIQICADLFDQPEKIKRNKIEISKGRPAEEILVLNEGWNLVELLDALYHLSVNDTIKHDIYETCKMKENLRKLIFNANNVEKEFSVKLLYQLCFDDSVLFDLEKDTDLIVFIKNLIKTAESAYSGLKKSCYGILWLLENKTQSNLSENRNEQKVDSKEKSLKKHIMISYNRESRDLCLSIKAELESYGFKIWIDVEDIRGSSLESMAHAIETCDCILMCMTEKYKLSSNCRLEAEYSVQLNKPIIPLILQKDYKPDGWLGIILGSKMFVNFTKYSYEECMNRLLKELSNVFKDLIKKKTVDKLKSSNIDKNANNNNTDNNNNNNKSQKKEEILNSNTQKYKDIIKWSENDVEKWMNEKSIQKTVIDNLKPCSGKILFQMFKMMKNTPEFFYTALRTDSNNNILLKDLAGFCFELNLLFEEDF